MIANKQRKVSNTHRPEPRGKIAPDAPREALLDEFSRRLAQAMTKKGWSQVESARQVTNLLPEGVRLTADLMSKYVNGVALPRPVMAKAISSALDFELNDLLTSAVTTNKVPPLEMHSIGDGYVWLRINQAVPWDVGVKILTMLKGD